MKTKLFKNQTCFVCSMCGFAYKDKNVAQDCEHWCKEYKSCNMEITKNAVTQVPIEEEAEFEEEE